MCAGEGVTGRSCCGGPGNQTPSLGWLSLRLRIARALTSTAMRSRSMAGAGAQQLSGVGKSRP